MKRAWVITQEGTSQSVEVVGLLSARKHSKLVKGYLEWLYALLHYSPSDHFEMIDYKRPTIPYEAEYQTTNTGVKVADTMTCGANPFLVARLAKDVDIINRGSETPILKWTDPNRIVCDERSGRFLESLPGGTYQATVRLPLVIIKL